jgi:hypothetical protein
MPRRGARPVDDQGNDRPSLGEAAAFALDDLEELRLDDLTDLDGLAGDDEDDRPTLYPAA